MQPDVESASSRHTAHTLCSLPGTFADQIQRMPFLRYHKKKKAALNFKAGILATFLSCPCTQTNTETVAFAYRLCLFSAFPLVKNRRIVLA